MASNIKSVVYLITVGKIGSIKNKIISLAMGAESKVIWVCVVGAALGFTGIRYSIRRNRRSAI